MPAFFDDHLRQQRRHKRPVYRRVIIKTFRLTGYAVTVPEIWEGMEDEEDQIGGKTGAPGQDNY